MDSELTIADGSSADLWTLDALDGLVLVKVIPEPALSIDVYAGTVCYHYRREWGPDTTRAPVFGLGQPAQFLATFDNYSREDLTVPFRLRVKPTEPTAPIKWTTIQVTVPRCSRQTQRISWLPTHNGTFALEWTAQVGQHDFSGVVRLGVVPPQDPEIARKSSLGILHGCFRMTQAANMGWMRLDAYLWSQGQSRLADFDWKPFERNLDWAQHYGVRLVPLIISSGNPKAHFPNEAYCAGQPLVEDAEFKYYPEEAYWPAEPLSDYSEFREFMEAVGRRFKGRQACWEYNNETNMLDFWTGDVRQYVEGLKAFYLGLKAGDPSCLAVHGGLSGIDMAYLEELRAAGFLDYTDAINVHPYVQQLQPECLIPQMQILTAWRDRHAPAKPIWSTEFGYWLVTDERLTAYTARSYLIQLAYGVEVAIVGVAQDGFSGDYRNDGLFRTDFSPKQSYVALAVISSLLTGKKCVSRQDTGQEAGGIYAYRFVDAETLVEVLWSTAGRQEITLELDSETRELDVFGNPVATHPPGQAALLVDELPRYLVSSPQGRKSNPLTSS